MLCSNIPDDIVDIVEWVDGCEVIVEWVDGGEVIVEWVDGGEVWKVDDVVVIGVVVPHNQASGTTITLKKPE